MKLSLATRLSSALAAVGLVVCAGSVPAEAKGCLRGAAAGAVAGHLAHHHAIAGAAIGCVAMHHHYAKKARMHH